jgi:hypothetical protein
LLAAEDRIKRGVGLRRFFVGYHDKGTIVDISDELAMLAPKSLNLSTQPSQKDLAWLCHMGVALLREIVSAGAISNRIEWGVAKQALCYLYYDLILRHYGHAADHEQIFYLEDFRPPPEPPDIYWLILDDDRDKLGFKLLLAKPDDFPNDVLPVLDEAHFSRRH